MVLYCQLTGLAEYAGWIGKVVVHGSIRHLTTDTFLFFTWRARLERWLSFGCRTRATCDPGYGNGRIPVMNSVALHNGPARNSRDTFVRLAG